MLQTFERAVRRDKKYMTDEEKRAANKEAARRYRENVMMSNPAKYRAMLEASKERMRATRERRKEA